MSQHSPCKLISYRELSQTGIGFALWNSYMEQVRAIALQYPNHFTKVVAKEAITKDAQTHRFYAYLLPENRVTSFCVVVVTYLEAELVWMATHKDYRRKGYASELVRFIEATLFSPNSSISMIIGKPATPDAMLSGTKVGGKKWLGTNLFHKHMGYSFRYKLEDYWEVDDHAALFVKRRTPGLFGYVTLKEKLAFPSQHTSLKEDRHPVENKAIQQDIRNYIISFRREVTGIRDSVQKIFQDDSELEGFAGVAFVPISSGTATIFAEATQKYSHEIVPKFEYEIDASILTRILVMKEIPDTGVVFYPTRFDEASEIKLHDNFRIFLPELQSPDGYTLFYHREWKDDADSMCVLYFVIPLIKDVVVAKRNWHMFTKHSFALFMGISEILEALIETHFKNNNYLRSLLNCVPLPTVIDNKYANMHVELLRQQMSKQINALNQEKLKAKESAIVHYGHTLGHRLSPIQTYFEGNERSMERAKSNAAFLSDLSITLQANNIVMLDELYHHPKKERFLDYDEADSMDIVQKIRNEWRYLAESYQPVVVSEDGNQERVMTLIDFTGRLKMVQLSNMLVDSISNRPCRLKEAFYSQLLIELLLNAVRYSGIPKNQINLTKKIATVRVALKAQTLRHKSTVVPSNCTVITLANKIGDKTPPIYLSQSSWTLWPAKRENDGPGAAIATLRRLGLGELWYRYSSSKQVFRVAIWLEGLSIDTGGDAS